MTTTPTTEQPAMDLRSLERIELQLIDDNPWQPRTELDGIEELAADIEVNGLLQAPMVRATSDGRYQLAFGHRRLAAVRSLGWPSLQVEVKPLSDQRMAIIALSENTRRRDLKPMEEYRAWQKALEIEGMTQDALSAAMGLDRSTVANNLRLLRLPDSVLKFVDAGDMSAHGAREFLCLMGSDGHFHDDEASAVIDKLTTGAPDWRVARVRLLLQEEIERAKVADWRILFTDILAHNAAAPAFDLGAFKREHAERVHTIPNDDWGRMVWKDGEQQPGKLQKEGSREWTCATSAWAKAQTAGKKAAEGVAGAASKNSPVSESSTPRTAGKTSKWPAVLSQDPVFKKVTPDTDGPLMKTLSKEERNAAAALQIGTRGTPGIVPQKGKGFAGVIDERHDAYGWYGYDLRERPGYFADVIECRTTCTTGATYMQKDGRSPFELMCRNEACFDQHCTKGRQAIEQKVGKAVREVDARDAGLYELLDERLSIEPTGAVILLAALMLKDMKAKKVSPETRDWQVDKELSVWPANAQHMAAAVGLVDVDEFLRNGGDLHDGNARELLLRAVVERSRGKEGQAFVDHLVTSLTEPALPTSEAPAAEDGLTQE